MDAKVVIGVPHLGDLPGYFAQSLISMLSNAGDLCLSVIMIENKPTDMARSLITKTFLEGAGTHLFFADADMMFPANTIRRLVEWDLPVVGGTYFARTETPVPHFYQYNNEDAQGRTWYRSLGKELAAWVKRHPEVHASGRAHAYQPNRDDVVEVEALATGCMLIKREVLEKLEYPAFRFWPGIAGGEDFRFCRDARAAGYGVYVDMGLHCAHEAQRAFMGVHEFVEAFDIGGEYEVDFDQPMLVELGPKGDTLITQPAPQGFKFPHDVEGYLTFTGGALLSRLANEVPADGLIVELGTYKGRSTICLAQSGRRVWTVDHFSGESLEQIDNKKAVLEDHLDGRYEDQLVDNLVKYGVADNVIIQKSDSAAFGREMQKYDTQLCQVDLLFVDAAHDYASVKADVEAWEPLIAPGGVIVMDDVAFSGVERVVAEMGQRGWRHFDSTAAMVALRRER